MRVYILDMHVVEGERTHAKLTVALTRCQAVWTVYMFRVYVWLSKASGENSFTIVAFVWIVCVNCLSVCLPA